MGLLKIIKKTKAKEKELRLLILGLDNAGKTTILKKFLGEDTSEIAPTLGFQIKTIEHNNFKLNIWDVGGQTTIRSYWRNYFEQTDGLIWVVDSGDKLRLEDCRAELQKLLQQDKLAGATLLVFCNKQDIAGALTTKEIREVLELDKIEGRHWSIFPCSAMTGEGLLDGKSLLSDIQQDQPPKSARQTSVFLVEGNQKAKEKSFGVDLTHLDDSTSNSFIQHLNTTSNSKISQSQQAQLHYSPVKGQANNLVRREINCSFNSSGHQNTNVSQDQQEAKSIFQAIVAFDLTKLTNILQEIEIRKSLEIVNLVDEMGYTVLHSAAYYNTYKIAEFLISFFRRRLALYLKQKYINKKGLQKGEDLDEQTIESIKQRVRDTIKEWVNIQSRGDEGFYPLHFASFHGNLKLIKLLVKCGANIYAKNRQGINMLHVAAQGDQAYSLTYFRDLGIPLTDKDGESSTPLHWACFAGSDTAIYYLLAWGLDVNAQDNIGNTALHLAIKSAENFPNTRAIKELLIKGADRNKKDSNHKSPIDLVQEIKTEVLKAELSTILVTDFDIFNQFIQSHRKSYCGLSQVKQPLMKVEKTPRNLSIQVLLVIGTLIAMIFNVFPYITVQEWIITLIALFGATSIFFILTWLKDPGYLDKSKKVSFLRLVEKLDPNMLCPTCEVICSSESRHCYICNKCVDRFDHHCQWVNNCIGIRNHLFFYLYILSMEAYMISIVIFGIICKLSSIPYSNLVIDTDFNQDFIASRVSGDALFKPLYDTSSLNPETLCFLFRSTLFFCTCLACFFLVPLSLLVLVQTQNFLYNQTTNTRFGKYKRPQANDQLLQKVAGELNKDSDDDDEAALNDGLLGFERTQENEDEFKDIDLGGNNQSRNRYSVKRLSNVDNLSLKIMVNDPNNRSIQPEYPNQRRSIQAYVRNCISMCCGAQNNTASSRSDLYYKYHHESRQQVQDPLNSNDRGTNQRGPQEILERQSSSSSLHSKMTKILIDNINTNENSMIYEFNGGGQRAKIEELDRQRFPQKKPEQINKVMQQLIEN